MKSERPLNVVFYQTGIVKKRIHRGSDFRDFLKQEGLLEEVEERAMKKALALQLEKLIVTKIQIIYSSFFH